jgi:transcriptional regulator GlxA family with amidase domain
MADQVKRIAMLLYDDCDLLDFSGPTAAFHSAARHLIRSGHADDLMYVVEPLSIDGGHVRSMQGIVVETKAAPELSPGMLDTFLVIGGTVDHTSCDPRILEWIARNSPQARRVASVCCGAFLLGGAGLLDGRRATTHWEDCERLRDSFPLTEVQSDAIFVQDGKFWTAAGITAGIDMALAMIEEDHGHRLALMVARNLVVFLKRPGGQSQFSTMLQSQSTEGPLGSLLDWIVEHPRSDLRAEALADRANMSLRNFYRAFEAVTGESPSGCFRKGPSQSNRLPTRPASRATTPCARPSLGRWASPRPLTARGSRRGRLRRQNHQDSGAGLPMRSSPARSLATFSD